MPYVKTELVMRGSKQAIYDVIRDMVSYPKFMKNLESVKILEQDENTDLTHWVSNVDGRKIVWTERDFFYPDDFRITYSQTEGDLKKMEGAWELETVPDGVRVSLAVDFEFGIPMIAGLLNPILVRKVKENSNAILQAVKAQVEQA